MVEPGLRILKCLEVRAPHVIFENHIIRPINETGPEETQKTETNSPKLEYVQI